MTTAVLYSFFRPKGIPFVLKKIFPLLLGEGKGEGFHDDENRLSLALCFWQSGGMRPLSRVPVLSMLLLLLTGCAVERIFYYPNRVLYANPDKIGLTYNLVTYPSANGRMLSALYFPAAGPAKGTIVHFHGNFANMSNHFPASYFLVQRGFNVLVFDYQGYGASEGKPSRRNTVEDGQASVQWALSQSTRPVGIFGQSLGAAVATVVASKEPAVKAVVLESCFTTYRAAAAHAMKQNVFTWPFAWVFPPLFVRRALDPWDWVDKIAPRPVFFIHGTADRIVPGAMSEKLFARAQEPKRLWLIPDANHMECRRKAGNAYETTVAAFFEKAFKEKRSN